MATNKSLEGKLVVAISSRALFNFEDENHVFEQANDKAYMELQLSLVETPAKPGIAFSLVQKLLAYNSKIDSPVEVVILSRNDPVTGLRIMHSVQHYGLPITRSVFTRGEPPWRYLIPLSANLFLSANLDDVRSSLEVNVPAAHVFPRSFVSQSDYDHEVRIAFDGDAVLFSDDAEKVYQSHGLEEFQKHEKSLVNQPLPDGPFKPLLIALHKLQQIKTPSMRIRTALVTARSAPAHERAIRTLMNWNIEIDEAMFLGGLDKGAFLREFQPDFFFDDQMGHITSAVNHNIASGLVANGVCNI